MPREINPKDTTRAEAYTLWMNAPNPMVTFFKTLDVTNLIRVSRKRKLKFNLLMDYCIGKAASHVREFYTLPVGDKLIRYDTIAVNTIVKNKTGEVVPATFCSQRIWKPLIVNTWIIPIRSLKPAQIGICQLTAW